MLIGAAAPADNHARIEAAADTAFLEWVADDPNVALSRGLSVVRLPDPSPIARKAKSIRADTIERQLTGIDMATVSLDDAILLDKIRWYIGHARAQAAIANYVFPVGGYTAPVLGTPDLFNGYPLETQAERVNYLALLNDVARLIADMAPGLKARADKGIAIPATCLAASAETWAAFSADTLIPARDRFKDTDQAAADTFLAAATHVVHAQITPAIRTYVAFARGPFTERASGRIGMAQYRGGRQAYALAMQDALTSDASGATVNALGRSELARIAAPRAALFKELGYSGMASGLVDFIKTSRPDLNATSRLDYGKRIDAHIARIKALLPKYFLHQPTIPFVAQPMPEALESSVTYGWYQVPAGPGEPGIYNYNGAPGRPLLGTATLAWHEGLPGHHYQYDLLAARGAAVHPLLREGYTSFFSEGWAVYATVFAGSLGLQQDTLDRYDSLQDIAFMAMRLVVDTGLNGLKMREADAYRLMVNEAGLSDSEAKSELMRYTCQMPGQALGYQYGNMAIAAERARAQKALGDRFDIRQFHDAVLRHGEIGKTSLDRIVDDLIAHGGMAQR